MRRTIMLALAVFSVWGFAPPAHAVIRLIAITGELHTGETIGSLDGFAGAPNDETLYELSLTDATPTRLFTPSRSPDTNAIGYNPNDGLIYHLSGSEAYRNSPERWAYNDNQQMETIDINNNYAMVGVFNSNGPPGVEGSVQVQFGLSAPRPDWVLPALIRTDEQIGAEFREKGPNEYSAARGVAWSEAENLFYLTSLDGLYRLTATGQCTFVAPQTDAKGIAFAKEAGVTKMFIGTGGDLGAGVIALLQETNPATGDILNAVEVKDGLGNPYQKILALAGHPETGALYGLVQKEGEATDTGRELVTINPTTGVATLIGIPVNEVDEFAQHAAFVSLAFAESPDPLAGDYNGNGKVDAADYVLWRDNPGAHGGDPAGYNTWRANFGNPPGSGAVLASAVPEPSSIALVAFGVMGLFVTARRRQG